MLLFLVNPIKQVNKARDAQRKEDFKQIRVAVDTYYHDHNCYPTSLQFGHEWKEGNTVYMKTIPQDPSCSRSGSCYTYVVDSISACPQWNVLFGKLAIAPTAANPACLLQSDCLPNNYASSGYNLCDFGGNLDCQAIQAQTLTTTSDEDTNPPSSGYPTATGFPPSVTPLPSAVITVPPSGLFYCGCGNKHVTVCNVTFSVPPGGIPYYLDNACSNQCGQPC